MATVQGSVSLDAFIYGGRWQHHRLRDHFGIESDLFVGLTSAIGPWQEGTPIHHVIEDIYARLATIESYNHVVGGFTSNAYLLGLGTWVESPAGTWSSVSTINAVLKKVIGISPALTFSANAWKAGGATFTIDATIRFQGSFTASAQIL